MNRTLMIISAAAMLGLAGLGAVGLTPVAVAQATNEIAPQTQTFTVAKMTCAACPITVRTAMQRVDGVRSVKIDFEAKTAIVTFDPAVTTAGEIAQASADAGYPAQAAGS